jgi:hypothetical protein
VMIEKDQKGHIDQHACTTRGLPPGPSYRDLKNGLPVVLPDGTVLRPEEVVGPDLCGRKVVVLGDTCDPSGIAEVAKGADLLVHEATFDSSVPVRVGSPSVSAVHPPFECSLSPTTRVVHTMTTGEMNRTQPPHVQWSARAGWGVAGHVRAKSAGEIS